MSLRMQTKKPAIAENATESGKVGKCAPDIVPSHTSKWQTMNGKNYIAVVRISLPDALTHCLNYNKKKK